MIALVVIAVWIPSSVGLALVMGRVIRERVTPTVDSPTIKPLRLTHCTPPNRLTNSAPIDPTPRSWGRLFAFQYVIQWCIDDKENNDT